MNFERPFCSVAQYNPGIGYGDVSFATEYGCSIDSVQRDRGGQMGRCAVAETQLSYRLFIDTGGAKMAVTVYLFGFA